MAKAFTLFRNLTPGDAFVFREGTNCDVFVYLGKDQILRCTNALPIRTFAHPQTKVCKLGRLAVAAPGKTTIY
jgi:hypothetical protein